MSRPQWVKPGIIGVAVGAVALAIVGFSWAGWVTGGTAEKMASDQARLEVVAALVPICVAQSSDDPKLASTMAELKDAQRYQRRDLLMKAGWATMPGANKADRDVANACMDKLAEQF